MNGGGGIVAPGGSWKGPRVRFVRNTAAVHDWSPWQGLVFECDADGVRLQPWETIKGPVVLERMDITGAQCGAVWQRCVALIGKKGYGTVRAWWKRVSGRGSEGRMMGEEFIEKTREGAWEPQGNRQQGLLPEPNQPGLYLGKCGGEAGLARTFWLFWVG
jgi:hypothetical protein